MDEKELLIKELSKYKSLASAVIDAEFWDYSVYEELPDDSWVAIDRKDYDRIMQCIHQIDQIKPWKSSMEKRLEHYR
ncbi:hypothetical protein [Niallia oryzisoli]|uniref:hypothetical protein n=1 Tax=Niallia oryzisoli TaxID=1737571 RepID=UPI003736FE05